MTPGAVRTSRVHESMMRDKISNLRDKLSKMPTNWSMQKTMDGRQRQEAIANELNQKRSMSTTKQLLEPFAKERQTVPSVFLHDHDEKQKMPHHLKMAALNTAKPNIEVPNYIPQSTLTDPFNQLNSPLSVRSKHIK